MATTTSLIGPVFFGPAAPQVTATRSSDLLHQWFETKMLHELKVITPKRSSELVRRAAELLKGGK